jgi:hypothetical protein
MASATRLRHVNSGLYVNIESACAANLNTPVNIRANDNTCNLQSFDLIPNSGGYLIRSYTNQSLCVNTVSASVGQTTFLYTCTSGDRGQVMLYPVSGQFVLKYKDGSNPPLAGKCLRPDNNYIASPLRVANCVYGTGSGPFLFEAL